MSILLLIAVGWITMALLMVALWLVQRRTGDAGIVDAGWACGIGLLALFYAVMGEGLPLRRLLVGLMAALWAFRLAAYLLKDRVFTGVEDGRYEALRAAWGAAFQRRIFWFFQGQGMLSLLFSLPLLVAMSSRRPQLAVPDGLAALVWIITVAGESAADRQLAAFRADPANRGRTCRQGLWRLSRHPNYFFEWLHWWSYAIIAIGSPGWWIAAGGPVVMLIFIFFVTGIPPTEARALRSRGEDYRDYQRTTPAFIPWFPKSGASLRA